MENRWQMNRMGFVNFWLYDEETFSFADGKLLLRGQNGSGKSITTQSFIPFILDGDRTPSRLDPFGSSDRRMEYYFLGEGDNNEATGYLFLEFKRKNTNQYRTIGIGQRAQKGKAMGFWGFIVMDGRRIGYDMDLYRSVGSKKIPLTKQELKNLLGEENIFAEKPTEYKTLVNKQIFGFPREEQYEQFIKLLIKVRAPKLSKEFKPTKVYEILNDSLQTLSDEDLLAMVEAMEKLDDIQSRLDGLKATFKDLGSLRKEYDRYNRYMLGKKAEGYLEEKKKVDSLRAKATAEQNEIKEKKEETTQKLEEIEQMKEEKAVLLREKDGLDDAQMENAIERLQEHKANLQEKTKEQAVLKEKLESNRQQIAEYDGELRDIKGNIELRHNEIDTLFTELDEENQRIEFTYHAALKQLLDQPKQEYIMQDAKEALRKLESEVDKAVRSLTELAELERQWEEVEKRQYELKQKEEAAKAQLISSEKMEQECRDHVIEEFYTQAEMNKELSFNKETLRELITLLGAYGGARDFGNIQNLLHHLWERANTKLSELRSDRRNEVTKTKEEVQKLEQEYQQIQEMREPVPKRHNQVVEAREILKSKNITYLSFYETVEFAKGITQEEKDMLESQLASAGLLDALVVAEHDYIRAKQELQTNADVLIWAERGGSKSYNKLKAGDILPELKEMTERILTNIGEDSADTLFVMGAAGYFKNGILEGYSKPIEEASYIGVQARIQKKERLLAEKYQEKEKAQKILQIFEQQLLEVEERISILEVEYEKRPRFGDLDQAIALVRDMMEAHQTCYEKWVQCEQAGVTIKESLKRCEQTVIAVCKPLPYVRNLEIYQEVKDSIPVYRDALSELKGACATLSLEEVKQKHTCDLIEKEEDAQENNHYYLHKVESTKREIEVQVKRIEEYLGDPSVQEKAARMQQIKEELEQKQEKTNENEKALAVLGNNIQRLQAEIEIHKAGAISAIEKETILSRNFEEELTLELVIQREQDTLLEAANRAKICIRENDVHRSGAEMATTLMERYQAHRGTLISYGTTLEECFADDIGEPTILRARRQITSVWNGKKLYLEEFYQVVKEAINANELLIQKKDRELFEGILADTLSRKLSNRISESRKWIANMSSLMEAMDTSMGLTFSLDWKPIYAQGEKELDTRDLEKILRRDRELLTTEDIEKVSVHFRTRIHTAKQLAEENEEMINYADLVREALDYRKWFEFRMFYYRNGENKKELTNGAFNRFSGGEKAMAMYVPLFAAVNAQYKKTEKKDHPRMIALDEAFAGVDDKNINSMFELVQKLEFDYIMNSQILWGCYKTVKNLRIAELLRPANSNVVTAIYYHWNGREKVLDEQ
jgi:TIGR02680 family protein